MSNEINIAKFNAFISDLKNNPNDSLTLINCEYNSNQDAYEAIANKIAYTQILSMKINSAFAIKGLSVENYFTDKKFQNYPMLGVPAELATYYCTWKHRELNKKQREKGLPDLPNFRLPTETEFEYALHTSNEKNQPTAFTEVKQGKKNKHKLYHLNANAPEWVYSTEHQKHHIYQSKNPTQYTKSKNYGGFRCVMPHPTQLK